MCHSVTCRLHFERSIPACHYGTSIYHTTTYPTNMIMLAIFLCSYGSLKALQLNYFQGFRNPSISSIDFSESNLCLCWNHYVNIMQITAPACKLGRNLLQVWKSSSSKTILEAMIWSQTLSLVDKCQVQMCEYPLAFGLVQIINKKNFTQMSYRVVFS